mgnify:CR=1 FL=1
MPLLDSDADAQAFVSQADLSAYDLSGFKPVRFKIEPNAGALNMRLPVSLLEAIKQKAQDSGHTKGE